MHTLERRTPTIAFVDKVFLSPARGQPCGVEVFNLNLVRDLSRLGARVLLVAHPSWLAAARAWDPTLDVEPVPCRGAAGLPAFPRLRARQPDVLLLGNVGDRLIPLIGLLRAFRAVRRAVLIAHREPSRRFVRALEHLPTAVVAVNRQIANHFRGEHFPTVAVSYGITDADRFFPAAAANAEKRDVDFCVIGHLDRKWKGADTAVEAFRLMPDAVRARCRLHLASYDEPPAFPEPNIVPYRWLPFDRIGEFLRGMDAMLVPSRDEEVMRETFSQVAVQGMLTGLPLVVSDRPVLMEKVADGGGLVFRSAAELADAMARLAADPAQRRAMGAAGRAAALGRYVWNTREFVDRFVRSGQEDPS